ncbi:MAG: protein kinase [Pseudomonadota bacterium]
MLVETLSAELERLFELPELTRLSRDALGFEPEDIGGVATRASFARALAEQAVAIEAVDALLDAIELDRKGLPGSLEPVRQASSKGEVLASGDALGPYVVTATLGTGPSATVYRAQRDGREFRIKALHPRVAARRSDAHRYLTASRLAGQVQHPGLPGEVSAGALDDAGSFIGIAHPAAEGETAAAWLARRGARHFNEVLPLLWAIAEALVPLHAARLVHGSLHAGNVLITDSNPNAPKVVLLDPGSHLLRPGLTPASAQNGGTASFLLGSAPEQFRGLAPSAASDVYALGVLMYQLLSGKAPFSGPHAVDALLGHLTEIAEPLSFVAAGNGATPAVDTFVRSLLEKNREQRPRDASEALEGLRRIWRASTRPPTWVTDERLPEMFEALKQNPGDEHAATTLEASLDLGADPARLADGFYEVAKTLQGRPEPSLEKALKKHLARAARLYEAAARHETAEEVYAGLVELDPGDRSAAQALVRVKKTLGKYEELIESLLERSESSESNADRAEHWQEIGQLYENELKEKEQALVAYAQAFCEDPRNDACVAAVERLAGTRYAAWEDVLGRAIEALEQDLGTPERHALLFHMGRWYTEKVMRPDLALPWLTQLVAAEPNHDRALLVLSSIYKKAQQWPEYGQVLLRRADIAAPNAARDLRVEAAEVLESRLSNPAAARELYSAVLEEDPTHARAAAGQIALLEAAGDAAGALAVRLTRAKTLRGDERHQLLCEVAESYDVELDKLDTAEKTYREVLAENPRYIDALRGLDRVLSRAVRYRELLEVLRSQVDLALTARQKITLYERIAGIYDEEYLDHERAAEALETVLELDPEHQNAGRELARHFRAMDRYEALAALYERQASGGKVERQIETGLQLGRVLAENLKQPDRAIAAYERVLQLAPSHAGALDALATLRAVVGDAESALAAIDELVDKAATPEAKAELEVRAAHVLESRGDAMGALRRYKVAADLLPADPGARRRLVQKNVELGNHAAAAELLEEAIQVAGSERERAKLAGEMAVVCHKYLLDSPRALATAQLALHIDPSNADALRVLGRIAYTEQRYVEAAKRLEGVLSQLESLEPREARELGFLYVDALARSGAADKALSHVGSLMKWLSDDASALLRLAEVASEHGSAEQTLWLTDALLGEMRSSLSPVEEAEAELRNGQAQAKLGHHAEALAALERAHQLDPSAPAPLRALAKVHDAEHQPRKVMDALYRELALSEGDRKLEILLEMGDIASNQLADAEYAAKSYLLALSERPNDRTILSKLMQLYGAEKDWPQLIQVITRLADVVEEPKHKAKYLHTASMIASRELSDLALASRLLGHALEHDPDSQPVIDEALSTRQRLRDYDGVKNVLKLRIANAQRAGNTERMLQSLAELAEVYERFLGRRDQAVAVYESALEVEPGNVRFQERLANLYSDEPVAYFEKAVEILDKWVERDPYQPAPYKLLRKVYTEARNADAAWCTCQALHVLGQAEADEERFFDRMRSEEPADITDPASPEEWLLATMPEASEPFLTELFALIQPFVVEARARPLASFELSADHQIDVERYPYGVVFAVNAAARLLSVAEPRMYQNPEAPSGVSFLGTSPPALLLGARAFGEDITPVGAAFLAGRHLAYYLPGLYARQLLPNMTALKAWLFAAIRLVKPRFPVAPDLELPVGDASRALKELATGARLEQLTHVVAKLLRDGASLDLKRWVQDVDSCADAIGFVLANDLELAIERLRALPQDAGSPPLATRIERLIAYSVSSRYMTVREHLGLRLDGG